MGQSILEATAFARYADEDIRKGVVGNAKRETENAQFNGRMDGRRSLLGTDHIAGNEPAFSAMFFAVYTSFKLEDSALKRSLENGILQI